MNKYDILSTKGMSLIQDVPSIFIGLVLLAAFFVLGKTADFLVRALVNLGKIFRVSSFALSFVLLGLTTSLPEFFIGVYSIADDIPRLSLGNLLGGVIILLTLITGLNGLLSGKITLNGKFARYSLCKILPRVPGCHHLELHDLGIIGALLIAPALLLIDGALSRIDGAALIVLYVFFIWYYLREPQHQGEDNGETKPSISKNSALFFVSAVVLVAVTRVVVDSSEVLLTRFQVPPFIFGLIALSIGTNLPELTIMLRARKHARDVSIGNTLGSAAANTLLLGFLAIVSPLQDLTSVDMRVSIGALALITILFVIFFRTKNALNRGESLALVFLYIAFIIVQSILRPVL